MSNNKVPDNVLSYWENIESIQKKHGEDYLMMKKEEKRTGNSKGDSAKAAFLDILPELMEDPKYFKTAQVIYEKLYHGGPNPKLGQQDRDDASFEIEQVKRKGFPSHFESGRAERNSHGVLLQVLQDYGAFGGKSISSIASKIYEPYLVTNGGGSTNIIVTKKELGQRNLEDYDLEKSMRYFMYRAKQQGHKIVFYAGSDKTNSYAKYGKGMEALEKINKDIVGDDATGSMWPAVIRQSSGKGVQVVIMAGNKSDMDQAQIVGRLKIEGRDENGTSFSEYLKYDEEQMWHVFGGWRMGDFMDAENDWNPFGLAESTKTKMARYIEKYNTEGPPARANLGWWGTDVLNPGRFEMEKVAIPFWKKNSHLSDDEFDKEWEDFRQKETFNFEAKYYLDNFNGLVDPLQPLYQGSLPFFNDIFGEGADGMQQLQNLREMRELTGEQPKMKGPTVGDVVDTISEIME